MQFVASIGVTSAGLFLALSQAAAQDPWIFDVRLEDLARAAHGRIAFSGHNLQTGKEFGQFAEVADSAFNRAPLFLLAAALEGTRESKTPLSESTVLDLQNGISGPPEVQQEFRNRWLPRAELIARRLLPETPDPLHSPASARDLRVCLAALLAASPEDSSWTRDLRRLLLTMPELTSADELPLHLLNGGVEVRQPIQATFSVLFVDTPTGTVLLAVWIRDYASAEVVRGFLASVARGIVRRLAPGSDRPPALSGPIAQMYLIDAEVAHAWSAGAGLDHRDPPFERTRFPAGGRAILAVVGPGAEEPLLWTRWHLPGLPTRSRRAWGASDQGKVPLCLDFVIDGDPGAARVESAFAGHYLGQRRFDVSPRDPK